jgi:hypothetical protein
MKRASAHDIIIEQAGVRVNLSHAARVKQAKLAEQEADERRVNFAALPRDRDEAGELDWLESGRV